MTPMCKLCGEYEISTFQVHNDFCSDVCADRSYDYVADYDDSTADAETLASAGWARTRTTDTTGRTADEND